MQFSERKIQILSIINDNGGQISITELAKLCKLGRNRTTQVVHNYEDEGLLEFKLNIVSLTPKGKKRLDYFIFRDAKTRITDQDIDAIWDCYNETDGRFY